MRVRPDGGEKSAVRERALEQTELELDPEYPPYRVIDPFHRNVIRLHRLLQGGTKSPRAIRGHDHIETGSDRRHDLVIIVAVELVDRFPVGDEKSGESQLALEHVREQIFLRVHFRLPPARERNHDAPGAFFDGFGVGRQEQPPEGLLVAFGDTLIEQEFSAPL